MTGYQIQIQGLLDGATAFVFPTTIPAPIEGGVVKIDAGAGVAAGTFSLNDFVATDSPLWIRALHVEFAALTRAARFRLAVPGSQAETVIVPDLGVLTAVAPLMRPRQIWPNCIAPQGSTLSILTDDTDSTFSGAPVAGPHFIYLDVVPVVDDAQMGLIQDLAAFAEAKDYAQGEIFEDFQAVAASTSIIMGNVVAPIVGDQARMMLQSAVVTNGAVAAAGESMVVLVQQVEQGTGSVRTIAQATIDDTVAANSVTPLTPINPGVNAVIRPGDRIQVTRQYTAGGGPTPMTNTTVRAQIVPLQF